jgi:phosphate transport system permease protein
VPAGRATTGFAGSLALLILMLPVIIRSTEEMLKLVPSELREAAYALGVPKWRTGGIVTGIMLGVARIMGETAPLLLLVGGRHHHERAVQAGLGAALVLIIIIGLLGAVARLIARFAPVRG